MRSALGGEVFQGEGSKFVLFEGIDPRRDEAVFPIRETLEQGRYLEEDEEGVLIGSWLAHDLGAKLGDLLTVRCRTRTGSHQAFELEVVGIFNSPNPIINKARAFLPISVADELLEMDGGVTAIAVSFPDWERPEGRVAEIQASLRASHPGLVAVSWKDLAKDYLAASRGDIISTTIMLFLVFIIAAVGVSNTMLMAVMERYREIGMMRSLGMKDSHVRLAFLFEAGGIGFIGALAGLVLGAVLTYWITRWGIDYTPIMGQRDFGYRVKGLFRGAWHLATFAYAFFFGVFATILFSFIPSARAVKMKITDCLRHQ